MPGIDSVATVHTIWNGPELEREVQRSLGAGLKAGAIFLSARVKELISVPAPRKIVGTRRDGTPYYRATVKATPGAPPRKLSGELRRSVAHEVNDDGTVARVGTNKVYAHRLEAQGHPYLVPALEANQTAIAQVIGEAAR